MSVECSDQEATPNVVEDVCKYSDIMSLENGDGQDKYRLRLFFELLNKFTKDVTETHLDNMKKKHPIFIVKTV